MADNLSLPIEAWPEYTDGQKRIISEFESGKVKIKVLQASTYERHTQRLRGLTSAQTATLKSFIDGHMDEYFTWTPPGGASGNYIFASDPEIKQVAAGWFEVTMELQEVPV